jgi:hypothetical protein
MKVNLGHMELPWSHIHPRRYRFVLIPARQAQGPRPARGILSGLGRAAGAGRVRVKRGNPRR